MSTAHDARPNGDDTLEVSRVTVAFEGVVALSEVDLSIRRGEIMGLIGPNGAGKTTLLNVISGFVRPTAGRVYLDGTDVTSWKPHRRARKRLARSFQATRLFPELTVLENVEAGVLATGVGRWEAVRGARVLLERMHLAHRAGHRASALPAGDQHRVGVLRALALDPKFLLLDEPAAGLNEAESDELVATIRSIRDDFGCAVLVIDHDMRVIMPLCERIQVLNYGRTISIGDPAAVRSDPVVIEAYLGSHGGRPVANG
jgi:branched-chain amino acid transport system ATP-binding protein